MDEFIFRIGTFFLLIGAFLFIIFIASDMTNQTNFDLFFLSLMALVTGWIMRKKKSAPPSSGRFGYIRKIRDDAKKRQEEKLKAKKQEKKK